jgi:hypothetical protein
LFDSTSSNKEANSNPVNNNLSIFRNHDVVPCVDVRWFLDISAEQAVPGASYVASTASSSPSSSSNVKSLNNPPPFSYSLSLSNPLLSPSALVPPLKHIFLDESDFLGEKNNGKELYFVVNLWHKQPLLYNSDENNKEKSKEFIFQN